MVEDVLTNHNISLLDNYHLVYKKKPSLQKCLLQTGLTILTKFDSLDFPVLHAPRYRQ